MHFPFFPMQRHPDKSLRPSFREAVLTLTDKAIRVLQIPRTALDETPKFKNLGEDLQVGESVYTDLQTSYV